MGRRAECELGEKSLCMKLLKGKKEQEALLCKKVAHQALKSSLTGFFEMEAARGEGAGYVPWIMWLDAETGDFAQKMPDSLARRQHEVFFARMIH